MAERHGSLSISSDNIFPIIKKWMYSDHDIFYRELISNGCDAITKLKKLDMMGEYTLPEDYKPKIEVICNPEDKTLKFIDNGLGMTADEVEEYINQIAFSGATDFIEKYKDKANDDQIIGHFGLGFYSAFMVADEVHIDTLSYKDGATPVHWECDGGTEFSMKDGDREGVGTTITLFLNEDVLEFCNIYKAREVIKKYCSFMPVEIYLSKANTDETETIDQGEELPTDEIVETIAPKEDDKDKKIRLKIRKRPELLNDTHPLWTKNPSECTREEYLEFYRKVFNDYREPLFWIHLNMDYPFNLKGILYFPKLLKGVIDCPDLPLNVSRSALQNDGFVNKISDFITKKVADKLSGMCKTEKDEYEKCWDDIAPFIKFGCLKDDKFCEKMTDYILFKNLDGKYMTLPECLEVKPIDTEDEDGEAKAENADSATEDTATADEQTKDSTAAENGDSETSDSAEDEKKEKVIYYVTDEKQQSQYIEMFRKAKMDAVILNHNIDQPFISQLEAKNEGIKFMRIDADVTDTFKGKTSKKEQEEIEAATENISKIFKKAIKKDKIAIKLEKLKNKKVASMITLSEESRRMQDMMKMYGMGDMGGMDREGETLVLNYNHPLVKRMMEGNGKNEQLICEQLYDLARLQHAPLEAEEMTRFIQRSNDLLSMLAE